MKIANIEIYRFTVPYLSPLRLAIGEIPGADNIIIKLVSNEGAVGWGEASPFSPITGDSLKSNLAMAHELATVMRSADPLAIQACMAEIKALTIGEPSLRSAFSIALYDLLGKTAGLPLYRLFGGRRRELRSNLTIGLVATPKETAAQGEAIADRSCDTIKLKVGRPGLEDVAHVKALREAVGFDINIRIDANQGWDLPTAIGNLRAMEGLNLQYVEQPLKAWDYNGLARLRDSVVTPICADESVFDDKDAVKLATIGATDYLNVKLGKAGGIDVALGIVAIAEATDSRCMIGCFGESRLGLTAAAHLAMARNNIKYLDLDSADGLSCDPVIGGMTYDERIGGLLHLSDAPGLGAEVDGEFLKTCESMVI